MTEDIKNFVERYNKCMQWNKEIIKSLGIKNIPQDIIEKYLTTDAITEDGYDLENAKLFVYSENDSLAGTLELQAFSNTIYGTVFFWVRKDDTEEVYKAKKIEKIKNEMNKQLDKLFEQIKGLTSTFKHYNKLKKQIAKING